MFGARKNTGLAKMKNNVMTFALDSARTVDENGFLHVATSHITKATINPYLGSEIPGYEEAGLDPDRVYMALRDPDELRKSLSTWAGLPLQFEHHAEGADESEAKETRVGTVGTEVQWHEPYIDAPLTVWDADAIKAINDGTCRELSCAYWYEPDFTPGNYQGEPYDFVMRNIRGNHVALVPEGRAGHDVLVADSKPKPLTNREDSNVTRRLARDGDPAVEKKEAEIGAAIEQAGKDLQDMHAVDPAGNVVDKPAPAGADDEETACDTDLAAIKEKYGLSDEAIAEIQAALAPAADEECAADEDEKAQDADPEAKDEDKAEDEDDKAEDEEGKICDAMKACGLDADDPAMQKAFAEGVAYGEKKEKTEPEKLDREHESEGMEKAMQRAEDRALRRMQAAMNAKFKAADKVAPIVGQVKALSFDSADSIYAYALRRLGFNLRGRSASQYETLLDGYIAGKAPKVRRSAAAADSKAPAVSKKLSGLRNIRIED